MSLGSRRAALVAICGLALVDCGVAAAQGTAYPASAEVSDQKAGSVLVYPFYGSSGNGVENNTRINITQTADVAIATRIFFIRTDRISPGTIRNRVICLSAKGTQSHLASDVDPAITGYIVVVAVDANGCPIGANTLIGDVSLKLINQPASLTAYAFSALFTGTLSGCGPTSTTANVDLDGIAYNRSPRTVAIDKIRSPADNDATALILTRVGGNLATSSIGNLGDLSGTLFSQSGTAHPFSFSFAQPQMAVFLQSDSFPPTTPPFGTVVPAGTIGWMKLAGDADIGLLGQVVYINPNVASQPNAFAGGHGLRTLTLTSSARFVIPVSPPGCL